MFTAYLSLGSNIEPRFSYLLEAKDILRQSQILIHEESSIYETPPWGMKNQNSFLNMVLKIETYLSPFLLLKLCQDIEQKLHRKREVHWGPRTIDIDILLYEDFIYNSKDLILPHPYLTKRGFVLVPLSEISPFISIKGKTVKEHLCLLDVKDIKKYNFL